MKGRFAATIGLLTAFTLAVAGCIPVPIPHSESVVYGNAVGEEAFRQKILPGQTREEVIQRLGSPAYNFGAGRAFVYPWTVDKGNILILIPGGGVLGAAWADARLFVVVFDDDSRALKTGVAEIPLYRSVSGVVRSWMSAQELAGFIRPQPEDRPSTIIVYRRASVPCNPRDHAVDPYSPFAPTVSVDGETVGDARKGEFLRLAVTPGTHLVVVEAIPGFRRFESESTTRVSQDSPASLKVHVEPGQTIHAETWLCLEADKAIPYDRRYHRYQMHLELRDSERARVELSNLNSAWP